MKIENTLPRPWDAFDVYLFDIDGTLITCTDPTHYFAFSEALHLLTGRDLTIDGVVAHGNVDIGILRDALSLAGVQEHAWRPRTEEALRVMGEFVANRKDKLCTTVLPQVPRLLQHLREKGATIGVATGNIATIGQMKLESADLRKLIDFAGWSDKYETRSDVFRAALSTARTLRGPEASICMLGDTPADIAAAHDNDVPVIAVATGVYTHQQLKESGPEMLLRSFSDLFELA